MKACFCVGPQNGDPVCPCKMRRTRVRNGRIIQEIDLGPAETLPERRRRMIDDFNRRGKAVTDAGGIWGAVGPSEFF